MFRLILRIIGPRMIWKKFRMELIGHYHKDIHSPVTSKDMKFAFADLDGYKYYVFPHDQAIPIERLGKMQQFLMWIGAGMSSDQINRACEVMDKLLSEGLQKGRNAAKIGAVVEEIRMRQNGIAPIDLFYNYLAVQYVREDENPKTYNQDIQAQKVESFKRGAETADSFFFQPPLLTSLSKLLREPSENWDSILRESKMQEEIMEKKMKHLLTSA